MIIDIILAVILVLAVIKGYQRGLVIAVFSVLGFIIGLAAAIKLSAVVASYIGKAITVSDQWLPVISFAAVFIIVLLFVRWLAGFIQKNIELVMLGWVNKLGGVLLYVFLYGFIFSVILFYAGQTGIIKKETTDASVTWPIVEPMGPKVIGAVGKVLPVLKLMFAELQQFFGNISEQIPASE
ncbi:MAG: CvpA family protein [Bacteroidia bacterium]|nr:CvpA family protein [Bacteroidia bacterium]